MGRVTLNRWEQGEQTPDSDGLARLRALYARETPADSAERTRAAREVADARRRFDEAVARVRAGLRELEALANSGVLIASPDVDAARALQDEADALRLNPLSTPAATPPRSARHRAAGS